MTKIYRHPGIQRPRLPTPPCLANMVRLPNVLVCAQESLPGLENWMREEQMIRFLLIGAVAPRSRLVAAHDTSDDLAFGMGTMVRWTALFAVCALVYIALVCCHRRTFAGVSRVGEITSHMSTPRLPRARRGLWRPNAWPVCAQCLFGSYMVMWSSSTAPHARWPTPGVAKFRVTCGEVPPAPGLRQGRGGN